MLILGDHQALFITDGFGGDRRRAAPDHGSPDYPRLLAEAGVARGAAPAATTPLRLEGVYSLAWSLLAASDGKAREFSPNGIDLSALETDQR